MFYSFSELCRPKIMTLKSFLIEKLFAIVGLGSIAGIAPIETLGGGLDSTEPGDSIPIPESTVEQVRYSNVFISNIDNNIT